MELLNVLLICSHVVLGIYLTVRLWPSLSHGLNGLLCSSFGSVTDLDQVLDLPLNALRDASHDDSLHHLSMRLPLEPLCTENLSPFTKLLVCRSQVSCCKQFLSQLSSDPCLTSYFATRAVSSVFFVSYPQLGLARLFRHPMWFAKQTYKAIQIKASSSLLGDISFTATISVVIHRSLNVQPDQFLSMREGSPAISPVEWVDRYLFQNEGDPSKKLSPCPVCHRSKILLVSSLNVPSLNPKEM